MVIPLEKDICINENTFFQETHPCVNFFPCCDCSWKEKICEEKKMLFWNFEVFLVPWAIFYPISRIPTHVSDKAGHINWEKSLKNLAELCFLLSEPFIPITFITGQFHDVWKEDTGTADSDVRYCTLTPWHTPVLFSLMVLISSA